MSEGTGLNSWKILDGWLGYNGSGCTIIEDLKLSIFKVSTDWKTLSHFRNLPRKALLRDIANQGSETFVSFVTVFKKSCLCGLKQNKKQKSMYTANLPMTLYVRVTFFSYIKENILKPIFHIIYIEIIIRQKSPLHYRGVDSLLKLSSHI